MTGCLGRNERQDVRCDICAGLSLQPLRVSLDIGPELM